LARAEARIALTFDGSEIVAVEPGPAFDTAEWERVSQEIERSILTGTPKTGRDYSFSLFQVQGSWRGPRSGVQILPAPDGAPRQGGADEPFILEFPIRGRDLWPITNHRRMREHRKLTLLLNLLLAGRTSCLLQRQNHFWASVLPDQPQPRPDIKWMPRLLQRRVVDPVWSWLAKLVCGAASPISPNIKWVQEWYFAPLGQAVLDHPSPPAAQSIEEVAPEQCYTQVGNDGLPLRVPADLDESICHYLNLSPDNRAKFDRATFWLDMAGRQWTISVSASSGAYVSAIEALTERGEVHQTVCTVCGGQIPHEVPGATRRFKDFIETHAPGASLARQRGEMYALRSGIFHGSKLIELDYALAFGWDPAWMKQRDLVWDLSMITRIALRSWLKSQSTEHNG
jgi:hypothetical protein